MFLLLSFSFVIQSQTKLEVRAVKAYNQKDYTKAIEKYNAISKQKQLTSKQRLNLANSYYKIKDYQNAAKKYMSCISEGDTLSLPAYNNYLQSLKLFNYSEDFITAVINTILDSLPKEIIKRYDIGNVVKKVYCCCNLFIIINNNVCNISSISIVTSFILIKKDFRVSCFTTSIHAKKHKTIFAV